MSHCRLALRWILVLLSGLTVFSAQAVYLESTIYEMPSDKSFISKRIYNDSQKQNVYSISAVKIDKPGPGGENRSAIAEGELCLLRSVFHRHRRQVSFLRFSIVARRMIKNAITEYCFVKCR